jgi:hypothetical protein
MNILSQILNTEIISVDIETGLLYKYGESFNYNQRIYVLYDGIEEKTVNVKKKIE